MYFVVDSGAVMRRRCKQHDDCDVICEEKRIAFFHIEEKELLPQDKVTPYATRNKRIMDFGAFIEILPGKEACATFPNCPASASKKFPISSKKDKSLPSSLSKSIKWDA